MTDSERPICPEYRLTRVLDCIADPTKNRATGTFAADVSEVFPYLNAVMPNASLNVGAGSLTLRREGRILTFYATGAVMAKVNGAEDALAQLAWFCELCNEVWARRTEITPSTARRIVVGPLDLYWLLPRSNCQACGERTCMAFAFGLLLDTRWVRECTPLERAEHQPNLRRLEALMSRKDR